MRQGYAFAGAAADRDAHVPRRRADLSPELRRLSPADGVAPFRCSTNDTLAPDAEIADAVTSRVHCRRGFPSRPHRLSR